LATFTNKATLSFNGGSVDSNTVTGEILDVLSADKSANPETYTAGEEINYVISLRNTGPSALTGINVSDDLGAYTLGEDPPTTVYPLSYVAGSLSYYVNGVLQPAPTVTAGPPLSISGLSIPAGGSALLIYRATANAFAPPAAGGSITNTATISGGGLSAPLTVSATVTAVNGPQLSITKNLCPTTVTENGQISYTFTILNTGNAPALATDNLVLSDTFVPALENLSVRYNGAAWTEGTNYSYDEATGEFASLPGQISVPAATYTQNADGSFTVTPGVSTLVVTGTV